jgi:Lrp/AsnC family transcriptional regulator
MYSQCLVRVGDMLMDRIDLKILGCLQEDAMMPVAVVAEKTGLSTSPCWRRIQALIEKKIIRRRVALLDPNMVNVPVTVFVTLKTNKHHSKWMTSFAREVAKIPEVTEFYRMSGEVDYLLRIVVPDVAAYDVVYKRLISAAELFDVSSSFAMETIKYSTALPLNYANI